MCVSRSALCVHVCRSVCLVCTCVLVGLPSVYMCVGRSAFCVHVCWSVCLLCACVLVGLPSVCMCVGRSALCVHVCRSVCLLCTCVLVGLPSVYMCVGRSAFCVHVCRSVCLLCTCVCVGRSALCVHVCRSVCLVCVGRSALCVGRSALCVGRSACWCRLCKLCKFIWNKIEPNCSSSFAWGGRECHFLFSSAPLKYWKSSCSKLAPPPPPPHTHTHTIPYNTSQHKINHHCNQCFKDNVCKQRNLLVLGVWLSWVLYFILSKLKIYMGVMCICQWFNLYWNIHPHFALPIWM